MINITSINQIINYFNLYANSHPQLNDFGYGSTSQIGKNRQMKYPYLWVTHRQSSSITVQNRTQIPTYNFSFLIVDRINIQDNYNSINGLDSDNQQEIISDCKQIADDFIGWIGTELNDQNISFADSNITLEMVFDETSDKVTGVLFDIPLRVRHSNCIYPTSKVIPTGDTSNCPDVTVKNSDDSFTTTVSSGDALTLDDIAIRINGELFKNIPSVNDFTLSVKNFEGELVGSGNTSTNEWIVPTAINTECATSNLIISDTDDNELYNLTYSAGTSATTVISNSLLTINNTTGGTLDTLSLLAQSSGATVIPNSTFSFLQSDGAFLTSEDVIAGTNGFYQIADCNITIREANTNNFMRTFDVKAEDGWIEYFSASTIDIVDSFDTVISGLTLAPESSNSYLVADSKLTINNSSGGTITTILQTATATGTTSIDDSIITINSSGFTSLSATDSLNINIVDKADGTTSIGEIIDGKVMVAIPSGTTYPISYVRDNWRYRPISYIDYDIGWYLANTNEFEYTEIGIKPVLDNDNEDLLLTLNAFGNYNRITNNSGGTDYSGTGGTIANYAIDHYTGLGWYLLEASPDNTTWQNTASNIRALTACTFSDWRMPTRVDILQILKTDGTTDHIIDKGSYANSIYWVMDTNSATQATIWRSTNSYINPLNNFSTGANVNISGIACRNHF